MSTDLKLKCYSRMYSHEMFLNNTDTIFFTFFFKDKNNTILSANGGYTGYIGQIKHVPKESIIPFSQKLSVVHFPLQCVCNVYQIIYYTLFINKNRLNVTNYHL